MAKCPYSNEEKYNWSDGHYCDVKKEYITTDYYICYCNSDSKSERCPYRGGDDPDKLWKGNHKKKTDLLSKLKTGLSHSHKFFSKKIHLNKSQRQVAIGVGFFVGLLLLVAAILYLEDHGFFKGTIQYNIAVASGHSVSDYQYTATSQISARKCKVRKLEFDESGMGSRQIRTGHYAFAYRKGKDYQVVTSTIQFVSPFGAEELNLQIPGQDYFAVRLQVSGPEGEAIDTGLVQLDLGDQAAQATVYRTEDHIVILLTDAKAGDTLTLSVPGYCTETVKLKFRGNQASAAVKLTKE